MFSSNKRRLTAAFALGIVAAAALARMPAYAQTSAPRGTIELGLGSIFEIVAEKPSPNSSVNWVLTKDGAFLQSIRNGVFNARLTEAGSYQLNGEITDSTLSGAERIVLQIIVSEGGPRPLPSPEDSADIIATTDPPPGEDEAIPTGGKLHVVRITPVRQDIEQLIMDLDLGGDANGDGDPVNDNVLQGTIFKSGATSMHLWLRTTPQLRTMVIGAQLETGRIISQKFKLHAGIAPSDALGLEPDEPEDISSGRLDVEDIGDATYRFRVEFPEQAAPIVPVLYHWDFGDGQQSMLDQPEHTFGPGESYSVSVALRNLEDSETLHTLETVVDVPVSEIVPETQEPGTTEVDTPAKKGGLSIGLILKILGVLVVSILLGMGGIAIFAKLKGATLQKAVEKAESSLVGAAPARVVDAVQPMSLSVKNKDDEEDAIDEAPAPAAQDESPASGPSWLNPSATEEPAKEADASPAIDGDSAPAPSWLQNAAKPTTAPVTPEPAPSSTDSTKMPDWLSPAPTEAPTAPVSAEPIAPPPPAAPQTDAPTPPWLTGTTPAVPAPPAPAAPAPAPEPAEPAPPWMQEATQTAEPASTKIETPPVLAVPEPAPAPAVETPQNIPTTPATTLPAEPVSSESPASSKTPAWLAPETATVPETPPAETISVPAAVANPSPPEPSIPSPAPVIQDTVAPTSSEPLPPWLDTPTPAPVQPVNIPTPAMAPIVANAAAESTEAKTTEQIDRERERRRRKRLRYRQNKKLKKVTDQDEVSAPTVSPPATTAAVQTPETPQNPESIPPVEVSATAPKSTQVATASEELPPWMEPAIGSPSPSDQQTPMEISAAVPGPTQIATASEELPPWMEPTIGSPSDQQTPMENPVSPASDISPIQATSVPATPPATVAAAAPTETAPVATDEESPVKFLISADSVQAPDQAPGTNL